MTLDWSSFDKGSVGPERAFEAFSAQLFELSVRREYGDRIELYVLNGAGGDGGVEAFATLADGTVVGLQTPRPGSSKPDYELKTCAIT